MLLRRERLEPPMSQMDQTRPTQARLEASRARQLTPTIPDAVDETAHCGRHVPTTALSKCNGARQRDVSLSRLLRSRPFDDWDERAVCGRDRCGRSIAQFIASDR
jgi:hypothetical protein